MQEPGFYKSVIRRELCPTAVPGSEERESRDEDRWETWQSNERLTVVCSLVWSKYSIQSLSSSDHRRIHRTLWRIMYSGWLVSSLTCLFNRPLRQLVRRDPPGRYRRAVVDTAPASLAQSTVAQTRTLLCTAWQPLPPGR